MANDKRTKRSESRGLRVPHDVDEAVLAGAAAQGESYTKHLVGLLRQALELTAPDKPVVREKLARSIETALAEKQRDAALAREAALKKERDAALARETALRETISKVWKPDKKRHAEPLICRGE